MTITELISLAKVWWLPDDFREAAIRAAAEAGSPANRGWFVSYARHQHTNYDSLRRCMYLTEFDYNQLWLAFDDAIRTSLNDWDRQRRAQGLPGLPARIAEEEEYRD